jgi:hypothetical protein
VRWVRSVRTALRQPQHSAGPLDIGLEAFDEAAQGVRGDDECVEILLGEQASEVGLGPGLSWRHSH